MEDFSIMPISEVALKTRSKKEIYDLITTEGEVYLPPMGDTHYKFISQIIWRRSCISNVERSRCARFPIWKHWMLEACLNLPEITQILTSSCLTLITRSYRIESGCETFSTSYSENDLESLSSQSSKKEQSILQRRKKWK